MDENGHPTDTEKAANGALLHNGEAHRTEPSIPEDQLGLHAEIGQLRIELDRLRDQQEAFQRTPPSKDTDTKEEKDKNATEEKDKKSDDAHPKDPAGGVGSVVRRHPVLLIAALVATALLCVAGLRFWNYVHSYESTDDAEIDGHLDPISTRIDGTVVRVYVENTYDVKEGQALVDLDPRDYQVAIENAAANLTQAQQGVKAAQQNYILGVANVAAAVATNVKAQVDVKRYGELLEQGVIAREANDEFVMTGKVDAAGVNSDRAAVAAAGKMIGQAEAAVQAAQASLDQAKLNLSYTHIVAPASGVVGDKTVEVGQRLQPAEQLLSIVPVNDIWITADFRETQLRRMHRGQPVTVHVDTTGRDYKGYVEGMPGATGEVESLLPPENATGNYVKVVQRLPVRIRLNSAENADHRLSPGMSVESTVWVTGHPQTFW
ncbi:MAG: HlyD family secretion protein [Candidatus Binatus sp.]